MENKTKQSFKEFVKAYLPLIIIVVSILAIVAVVLVSTLGNNNSFSENPNDNTPVITDPDDDNKPVENPDDDQEDPLPVVEEWGMPVDNYTIGMDFSLTEFTFSETTREWLIHKAVDFLVEENTPVKPVKSGTVESVNTSVMDGTTVVIIHEDGMKSVYSSLASNVNVKAGDSVTKDTVIGYASDSGYGEFMEGSHLHFELYKNDQAVDPSDYLPF